MNRIAPLIATLLFAVSVPALGQEDSKQPETWEQKKAKHFKPISEDISDKIAAAIPDSATATPKQTRRVLVFYRCNGFIHSSIPHGNLAAQLMGKKTGAFDVDLADTYDVFTRENLARYDCILLNNTTHMFFPEPAQMNAFMDFVAGGKGLAGIHAASDNFNRHPECRDMVGGIFAGHPWNAGDTHAFKLDDPEHVLNAAFEGKGFWHRDEIYQYNAESYQGPEKLRILVSLDMSHESVAKRINDGPREVPVSWIRKVGDGRVFYTNFGHREDTFQTPAIVRHMLDGIQFAIGDLDADAAPTATVTSNKVPSLAPSQEPQ